MKQTKKDDTPSAGCCAPGQGVPTDCTSHGFAEQFGDGECDCAEMIQKMTACCSPPSSEQAAAPEPQNKEN